MVSSICLTWSSGVISCHVKPWKFSSCVLVEILEGAQDWPHQIHSNPSAFPRFNRMFQQKTFVNWKMFPSLNQTAEAPCFAKWWCKSAPLGQGLCRLCRLKAGKHQEMSENGNHSSSLLEEKRFTTPSVL